VNVFRLGWAALSFVVATSLLAAPQTELAKQVQLLRSEYDRLAVMFEDLAYPEPTPTEIEELATRSPDEARTALTVALTDFAVKVDRRLKAAIFAIGRKIGIEPTDDVNYRVRRLLLLEREAQYDARGMSTVGLFIEGKPRKALTELPCPEACEYCNRTYAYLATVLAKSVAQARLTSDSGDEGETDFGSGVQSGFGSLPPREPVGALPPVPSVSQPPQPAPPDTWYTHGQWAAMVVFGLLVVMLIYSLVKAAA